MDGMVHGSRKEVDVDRSRDLELAISAVSLRKEGRVRDGARRERLAAVPELRREAPSERGAAVATTLRFRDRITIARFVDFARRKRVEATIGKDGVWTTFTMRFRNKTARTTFIGQWGEESVERVGR